MKTALFLLASVIASLPSCRTRAGEAAARVEPAARDCGTPPASPSSGGGGSLTDTSSDGSSAANRLNSRIDELENQIRQMTGRFEEVEFASSQANRRIDKLVEDVDFRLNQLERGG